MDFPVIEGPTSGRDISYSVYYDECEDLKEIEKGIPASSFSADINKRNVDLEFRLLRKLTQTKQHMDYLIPNSPFLQGFNRYSDVLPYSDTIVKVSTGEYINANWITGPGEDNFFIATQGPLESTRNSFWKMIWEHDVKQIIMISAIKEGGKVKCDQYFPIEETMTTADFSITLISHENLFPSLVLREFEVSDGEEKKMVGHLQSLAWPDHGTPELEEEFDSLKHIIDQVLNSQGPVLVHCSAGIGRTGTLIALCHMIKSLDLLIAAKGFGKTLALRNPRISVFGTVRRLREQRWGMVQTKDQYDFLYRFMEFWITRNN
ncbi:hypothetical protein SteCoe_20825 [Stentor coeruleus]|uniref:Protein-tyrosine-phosphatase n=1 Tax=Stentor coeruleus TaxID=5963 RepID=A0A1R2BR99_9CILI|nr:hypothetical protein SteCoe_20825 [Stentor coeruleus]